MLPKLAFDVFTEFITDVRNSTSILTTPDSEVDKFVEKMVFLKSVKSKEAKLDAQWQEVKQLYELIESAGIPVADFPQEENATPSNGVPMEVDPAMGEAVATTAAPSTS